MTSKPSVAIVGAGPAGATLARLLHLASIPCTIFEGETSASIRKQGSTLDLHSETGLAAIRKCGLWPEFSKQARYDGEANVFADKDYLIYMQSDAGSEDKLNDHSRPEIDRTALRGLLVESLPPDTIRWGHRVRSVGADGTLQFDHGTEGPFDLVVGADGAWSKVRPQLTDVQPYYSGIGGIGITIEHPETAHPDLYKQVNRGSLFAFGDGKGLQPQQLGEGSIHVYTWSKRPESWMQDCGFDAAADVPAVRRHLAAVFADWHPQLRKFTQVGNAEPQPRNLYMLPIGVRWEHKPGFAIIGDAAHLMTPFAGEGVNLAMRDAMDLAAAIIGQEAGQGTLDQRLRKFEEDMFERSTKFQQETKDNMDGLFDESEGFLQRMLTSMVADMPEEMLADVHRQINNPKQGP